MLSLRSLSSLLIASLALASCQSDRSSPNLHLEPGARREVIALQYRNSTSREDIMQGVVDAAKRCWLGKLPGFANLTMGPVERSPDGGMLVRFVDKKSSDRVASFHVVPGSGMSGYLVYVQQKGDGVDIVRPIDQAVSAVVNKGSLFPRPEPC